MKRKSCAAVIVAAGNAARMQGIDKTVTPICGVPMILRTVRALAASEKIDEIIVVTREDLIEPICTLCSQEAKFRTAVCGGETRSDSVLRGLCAVQTELAAIHDGARPFVTAQVIDTAIDAAEKYGAAAPAIAVRDTIKVAQNRRITATPERSTLYAVQTPQVFVREEILAALQTAMRQGLLLTDDCSAMEAVGKRVVLTEGSDENIKITTPIDLCFGEAIIKWRGMP